MSGTNPPGGVIILFYRKCHLKMNFKIRYSLSRTLLSMVRETLLASCSEDSQEVICLGEFTMAHLWHLPLKSQNLDFVSTTRVRSGLWGWLSLTQAKRGWCKSQKTEPFVNVMRNRNVTRTRALKHIWLGLSPPVDKSTQNTKGYSKEERLRNKSLY